MVLNGPLSPQELPADTCHAWTDGSYRISAGMGWVATEDDTRDEPVIAQGLSTLQVAFDAETAAILGALQWFQDSRFHHLVVHSDSTDRPRTTHRGWAGPRLS
jgi:ribonuclease HI